MAVVAAIRGDSYNMRFSGGYPTGNRYNSASISIGAGDLGSVYDLTNTGVVKYVAWHAAKNTPNARTFSILIRMAPSYTGTPAANRAILELNTGASASGAFLQFYHNTSGNLILNGKNQAGSVTFNSANLGAYAPTSGTYNDIVVKWDGTTGAGAGSVTVDNAAPTTATASVALDTAWDQYSWKSLALGCTSGVLASAMTFSELVIWDSLIDTSAVLLADGSTAALDGAARTSYVAASSFDGSASTGGQLVTAVGTRSGW